jgi:hypothetical protein
MGLPQFANSESTVSAVTGWIQFVSVRILSYELLLVGVGMRLTVTLFIKLPFSTGHDVGIVAAENSAFS